MERGEVVPEAFDWAFLLDGEDVMIEKCLVYGYSLFLVLTENGKYLVERNSDLDGDNYNAWKEIENARTQSWWYL